MRKKAATTGLLLIWIAAWQISCGTARQSSCEKHIKEKVVAGMPSEVAVAALKQCGFKMTMDPIKKTLYGDKVVEGVPVSERTQVLINLNSDNKVGSVSVSTGLIGP
jgi:hypothetical protein